MNPIEPPIYDGKESINKYIKKVEKYKNMILEERYNVILEFMNSWIESEFTSLTDFKNLDEEKLLKNPKLNRTIVRKYSDIFQNKYEIDLSVGIDTDSDEIKDKYIIYLTMKMLGTIDYYFAKRELGHKLLYTIRKKN